MSALEAVSLRAGYQSADVLADASLRVDASEVVALLGVNGAGKTTVVRCLAGLLRARAGLVRVNGDDVTAMAPHRRAQCGLRVVLDAPGLCASMTVADNLRLAGADEAAAATVAAWFPELASLGAQRAETLSGGEQRIVALARALLSRPAALVVDDISAGLSPALADQVAVVLRAAAATWGTGVLVAEQSTRFALGLADRAVVLARGRVALEGRADELASRPEVLERAYLGGV